MDKRKYQSALIYISLLFSFFAFLLSFLRVNVVISYEAFIGWMIALVGIIVAAGSLWQIYNYYKFDTKLEERIDKMIKDKNSYIMQLIIEKEMDQYKTALRAHIVNKDWDNSFYLLKCTIDRIDKYQSKQETGILMQLIWLVLEQIDSKNYKEELKELFKHVMKIGNLLDDKDKEKLNQLLVS